MDVIFFFFTAFISFVFCDQVKKKTGQNFIIPKLSGASEACCALAVCLRCCILLHVNWNHYFPLLFRSLEIQMEKCQLHSSITGKMCNMYVPALIRQWFILISRQLLQFHKQGQYCLILRCDFHKIKHISPWKRTCSLHLKCSLTSFHRKKRVILFLSWANISFSIFTSCWHTTGGIKLPNAWWWLG